MHDNPQKPKIIFMGTSPFAVAVLEALAAQYEIIAVYTKPDMKVGRKQEVQKSAVRMAAEKLNLPVETPERFDDEAIENLKNKKPDMLVVAAYGKILPKKVLDVAPFGAINVHPSLLPKYRGSSPIQNTLLMGEKETGVTIMLMDEGMDTGDILTQKILSIGEDETYPELSGRLAEFSAQMLIETISLWLAGKIKPQRQDDSRAIICQLIERADGKINWDGDAEEIYNRYRAFYSWPGVFTFWEKDGVNFRIKLTKISMMKESNDQHHIGQVFYLDGKTAVRTGEGLIFLKEVQMEGKNKMNIDDFHRGMPTFIGSILK